MNEEWKAVVGYETTHEVSNLGNLRSLDRIITANNNRSWSRKGAPIKKTFSEGYELISIKGKTLKVHALVMAAFVGPRPDGHDICHGDGDGTNNALTNLRYDTHANNMADMARHGRSTRGEKATGVKLTEAKVRQIRKSLSAGVYQKTIAHEHGVSIGAIAHISVGNNWKHVQ